MGQELGQGTAGMTFLCSSMSGASAGNLKGRGLESVLKLMLVASLCRKGGLESRRWPFCVDSGLTMSGVPLLCVVVCPNTLFLQMLADSHLPRKPSLISVNRTDYLFSVPGVIYLLAGLGLP